MVDKINIGEILQGVDLAIEVIDSLVMILVRGMNIPKDSLNSMLVNGVLGIIPEIVDSYELPILLEFREQREYWEQQFDRLTTAIVGMDEIFLIDVLLYETRESLDEYRKIVKGR